MNECQKKIGAICAAPIVLQKAGVLKWHGFGESRGRAHPKTAILTSRQGECCRIATKTCDFVRVVAFLSKLEIDSFPRGSWHFGGPFRLGVHIAF